ncbi:zinc ribbon domain-containing protein [Leptospira wolffii]|uniref:Uncharacterized protein n=1 Tax=Leptospira wolffii TaxID=409998 RepID=A0A2M9ZAH8_9LEPT|nr:zinc ribbon domain-containing protein [Leptospira wolffii]PJZ65347.1 hypothetical protein CH371_13190 [Leptospira wolffii]TGK64774.1 zinc ribbon domain-containing protein [Leptospira wolffii]TGK76827.1 zinc ribbon domain-containing protein [Leptospira wolffii]TGK77321.1 zinc ribbon domain-containing protein [Leptospira wolffii]TGL26716.1 zinc ribbon domain-containing protein [Leptospira wolffii]
MDFLLIFFYILLASILGAPFAYVWYYGEEKGRLTENEESELFDRRDVLLDNLKDLKIEFDTGKLTESEFKSISSGLIQELEKQDQKIKTGTTEKKVNSGYASPVSMGQKFCHNCGFKIEIVGAKFCPECGTKLGA